MNFRANGTRQRSVVLAVLNLVASSLGGAASSVQIARSKRGVIFPIVRPCIGRVSIGRCSRIYAAGTAVGLPTRTVSDVITAGAASARKTISAIPVSVCGVILCRPYDRPAFI